MAPCISVGQDSPVATVQFVPAATVAPHSSHITTASVSNISTDTTTRTTRQPVTVPPTKIISTKTPPHQPSVTGAKSVAVTIQRLTTVSSQKTAPPQPGILGR